MNFIEKSLHPSFPHITFSYTAANVKARDDNWKKYTEPMPGIVKIIVSTTLL